MVLYFSRQCAKDPSNQPGAVHCKTCGKEQAKIPKGVYLLNIGDPLTMGYFDNLDNGSLNKYKKS
jgi:hypothetical protein